MVISTQIDVGSQLVGEEKTIELVAKAGFDAWDFSMFKMAGYDWAKQSAIFYDHPLNGSGALAFARKLRKTGEDNGIFCNQSHAPFPVCCKEIKDLQKKAIECSAEAGAKICVIHPDNNLSPAENAEMYLELLPFAKECGVKIATENMWNWNPETDRASFAACSTAESFVAHLDAVNDPYFVACLDIGHAEMMRDGTTAVGMIKALGSRLQALHIHDNDRWHDNHQIPFSMGIDFTAVAKALKEIDYKGELTLEADNYLRDFTADNVFEGIKDLAKAARRLDELMK